MLDTFAGLIVSATLLTVLGLSLGGLLAVVANCGGGLLRAASSSPPGGGRGRREEPATADDRKGVGL